MVPPSSARLAMCTLGRFMETASRCPIRVLIFAASLRKDSLNQRLATLAETFAERHGAEVDRAEMSDFDCPSYDGDLETEDGVPPGAQRFRDRLLASDAFIIAAPEYNGSMSGVIKNAVDWTSRFRPQPFNGKQGMLMSASPSMAGGNRGLWALRVPIEHLGARLYPDMFSLAQAHTAFGEDGQLVSETLQKRLDGLIASFLDLVEASKHYRELRKQWVEFLGEHPDAVTDRVETVSAV
jgi:chromate reductase, NAD(P)H dehydrogenase (quinone)